MTHQHPQLNASSNLTSCQAAHMAKTAKLVLVDAQDALPVVDLASQQPITASSTGTFQLTWPAEDNSPHAIPSAPPSTTLYHQPTTPPSMDASASPEQEYPSDSPTTPTAESAATKSKTATPDTPRPLPRLSRAFSSPPLPSQLRHLQHPSFLRDPPPPAIVVSTSAPLPPPPPAPQADAGHFQELAMELADSVQMVIQTLIQISPPHLLDPVKEQYSACTLQLPTPSVSALLTTMKNLNYMSANLPTFSPYEGNTPTSETGSSPTGQERTILDVTDLTKLEAGHEESQEIMSTSPSSLTMDDFDIGEVMQSVGDVLSGIAAEAGVDLVLYHADVGMRHVAAKGDECGISYALCHVLRQVIMSARRGDTIDLGLLISTPLASEKATSGSREDGASSASFVSEDDGPILCTFEITHRFVQPRSGLSESSDTEPQRPKPQFNTAILQRLLRHVRATLQQDPQKSAASHRSLELSFLLHSGRSTESDQSHSTEEPGLRQPFPTLNLPNEPTLQELAAFIAADPEDGGGLKGKKAVFHACQSSSFAHHLTSYLTAWGLDVSHMPTDGEGDISGSTTEDGVDSADSTGRGDDNVKRSDSPGTNNHGNMNNSFSSHIGTIPEDVETPQSEINDPTASLSRSTSFSQYGTLSSDVGDASFIIIDDEVKVLRRRLRQVQAEAIARYQSQTTLQYPKKRPSLAAHHRPRSSPHIRLGNNLTQQFAASPKQNQVVIVHFTSLANYKVVKDTIQTTLYSGNFSPLPTPGGGHYSPGYMHMNQQAMMLSIPEVLVIPKPAGPRRFLTALHTAVRKPYVDPFFTPIATSPMSPGGAWNPGPLGYPIPSPLGPGTLVKTNSHGSNSSSTVGSNSGFFTVNAAGVPSGAVVPGGQIRTGSAERWTSPRDMHQDHGPLLTSGHLKNHPLPPSPQARESLEYFSETASKLGDHAAASAGMLLHSPDGRPAGIFFQPRQASLRMEYFSRASDGKEQRRRASAGSGGQTDGVGSVPMMITDSQSMDALSNASTIGGYPGSQSSNPASPPLSARQPRPSYGAQPPPPMRLSATALSRKTSLTGGDDPGRPPISRMNSSTAKGAAGAGPRRMDTPLNLADFPYGGVKSPALPSPSTPDTIRALPNRRATVLGSPADGSRKSPTVPLGLSALGNVSPTASVGLVVPGSGKKATRLGSFPDMKSPSLGPKKKERDNTTVPPISVLIVEDNPINQTILTTFMKRKKIHYGIAKNGQEAVDQWKTGEYHLILMDIQMPVKDGIEATKEIRGLEREQNIGIYPPTPPSDVPRSVGELKTVPIIPSSPFRSSVIIVALTASALKSDRVTALAAGCNDFLTKPVSLTWLNTKIIEWGSIKMLQRYMDPAFLSQEKKSKAIASHLKLPPSRSSSPALKPSPLPMTQTVPPPEPERPVRPTLNVQPPSSSSEVVQAPAPAPTTLSADEKTDETSIIPSAPSSPGSQLQPIDTPQPLAIELPSTPKENRKSSSGSDLSTPILLRSRTRLTLGNASIEGVLNNTPPVGERSPCQEPDPYTDPPITVASPGTITGPSTPSLSLTEAATCIVTGSGGSGYFDSKGVLPARPSTEPGPDPTPSQPEGPPLP